MRRKRAHGDHYWVGRGSVSVSIFHGGTPPRCVVNYLLRQCPQQLCCSEGKGSSWLILIVATFCAGRRSGLPRWGRWPRHRSCCCPADLPLPRHPQQWFRHQTEKPRHRRRCGHDPGRGRGHRGGGHLHRAQHRAAHRWCRGCRRCGSRRRGLPPHPPHPPAAGVPADTTSTE